MEVRKVGTIATVAVVGAVAIIGLSGGTSQVPRTPQGPPGMPTPFLGIGLLGSGGTAAAVDAYGNVVELRSPGPAGPAFISTPYKRQVVGSVAEDTGIVLRAGAGHAAAAPLWEAGEVGQRYAGASSLLETSAEVAGATVLVQDAIAPTEPLFARRITIRPADPEPAKKTAGADRETATRAPAPLTLEASFNFDFGDEDAQTQLDADPDSTTFTATREGRAATCTQSAARSTGHSAQVEPRLTVDRGAARWRWQAPVSFTVSLLCRFDSSSTDPASAPATSRASATPAAPSATPANSTATTVAGIHREAREESRRELAAATPLSPAAPTWATRLYDRSLLILLALSDRATGAAPAGLRDHWHYIWPRDAATVALALSEAGFTERAAAIARFLSALDTSKAARFTEDGTPVDDGRHTQGDGAGWTRLARQAAGLPTTEGLASKWRGHGDYGERDDDRGDYLANAIVAGAPAAEIKAEFGDSRDRLVREAGLGDPSAAFGDPVAALDTAAAWAIRPFPRPALFPLVRNTLLELAATAGPFGLFPASDWTGADPWTAATASVAWSLAALGERDQALKLIQAVRNAATPLGTLPERANVNHGLPRSTTPLAWSHAFTALALLELWPAPPAKHPR